MKINFKKKERKANEEAMYMCVCVRVCVDGCVEGWLPQLEGQR